jgi:hypothetical protein
VNTDPDPDRYRELAQKDGVAWANIFQGSTKGPVTAAWGVISFPSVYLLDRQGVVLHRDARGEALDKAVASALSIPVQK